MASPSAPILGLAPSFLLSLATMEWLLEQRYLSLNPASPFGFLGIAPRQTTPEEQVAAAQRELGRGPSPALAQALDIAARPDGRIQVTTQSRNQTTQQINLQRRGSFVAQAGFNTEGFFLGPPLMIGSLESLLVEELHSDAPDPHVVDRMFAPGALGLLTALWPRGGRDSAARLPVADALSACRQLGADDKAARAWVDALVESALVVENNASLSLPEDLRAWLARAWSEERLEVEVTPLPEGDMDEVRLFRRRERLLFVGPRGQRVVARLVDEASLEEIPLGLPVAPGLSGKMMALSYVDDKFLIEAVGALLRLTDEGLPDSVNDAFADTLSRVPDQAP